ncbi:TPA: hypothetical protein BOS_25565 [Bos taurus]|nr:TPA: hypothetical protein BOS_25565 [Bos taurus]
MPILDSWQMSLELALKKVVPASVVVGQSAGHPLPFLSWGPHQQLHRLLFPVQLTSLPPTPTPCGLRCQRHLLGDSKLGGCHFPVDITAGPSPSGTVSPAMSATEEHDWMPVPVPKSVLYFTKEASDYQYEESDEEVQEAEGEEEDSDKKPEEGPGKDLDPAEDSPGEPSCQA